MSTEITELTQGYIKSAGRTSVETLEIGERGPVMGRHWMVVDPEGKFILSDKNPKMAWIEPYISEQDRVLVLRGKGFDRELEVPFNDDGTRRVVEMFDNSMQYEAVDDGDEAANWLGDFLGKDGVRLVHMPDDVERRDEKGALFGFADSWSMTLGNDASLGDLNQKIGREEPIARERFGHDIWVDTDEPYSEDKWGEVRIGGPNGLSVAVAKPIVRCARTLVRREAQTLDELMRKDKEPLATLNRERKIIEIQPDGRRKPKVIFGQKLSHNWEGENKVIAVGDSVEVLVYKAPPDLE